MSQRGVGSRCVYCVYRLALRGRSVNPTRVSRRRVEGNSVWGERDPATPSSALSSRLLRHFVTLSGVTAPLPPPGPHPSRSRRIVGCWGLRSRSDTWGRKTHPQLAPLYSVSYDSLEIYKKKEVRRRKRGDTLGLKSIDRVPLSPLSFLFHFVTLSRITTLPIDDGELTDARKVERSQRRKGERK